MSQAGSYHEATKHVPGGSGLRRRIDPALIPAQFKRYRDLPSQPLPPPGDAADGLSPAAVSALLHYSNGLVRALNTARGRLEFRAASCTGAAYHIEAYLVTGRLGAIAAGVYHYDARGESLRLLRSGDFRANLTDALAGEAPEAGAFIVLSSTFWRNAWRYEERAYRHAFWDAGTVAANLLGLATELNLKTRLYAGFVDDAVNGLLGLEARREAAVCIVALGNDMVRGSALPAPTIDPPVEPLSTAEIEYPLIWRTHAAGNLGTAAAVRGWRVMQGDNPEPDYGTPLPAVIERRRSSRRFSAAPLDRGRLDALLDAATQGLASDFDASNRAVLLVHNVAGLDAGVYRLDAGGLSLAKACDFRANATHIALGQTAAGDAAINLYFVAHLDDLLASHGERAYRAAQLEAGVRGGRVYVAATALGLRVTGLTFYDDEVLQTLGLEPGTAVLFLVAAGR